MQQERGVSFNKRTEEAQVCLVYHAASVWIKSPQQLWRTLEKEEGINKHRQETSTSSTAHVDGCITLRCWVQLCAVWLKVENVTDESEDKRHILKTKSREKDCSFSKWSLNNINKYILLPQSFCCSLCIFHRLTFCSETENFLQLKLFMWLTASLPASYLYFLFQNNSLDILRKRQSAAAH